MDFYSPISVLVSVGLISSITTLCFWRAIRDRQSPRTALSDILVGRADSRLMVVTTGVSLATGTAGTALLATSSWSLADQWWLLPLYVPGLILAFKANGAWGWGFLLPFAAVSSSVGRMWHSTRGALGNLQEMIERQDEIQRFLLIAAVSMVCCMVILGARMEMDPKGNEKDKLADGEGCQTTIPRKATLNWMRRFGLYWSMWGGPLR